MAEPSSLEQVLGAFGRAFDPLLTALSSPETLEKFMRAFGLQLTAAELTDTMGQLGSLGTLLGQLNGQLEAVRDASQEGSVELEQYTPLLLTLTQVLDEARSQPDQLRVMLARLPNTFFEELLSLLIANLLYAEYEPIYWFARLIGMIEATPVRASPANPQGRDIDYVRITVRWQRLGTLIRDPRQVVADLYGWGSVNFAFNELALRLQNLLKALDLAARIDEVDPAVLAKLVPTAMQAIPLPMAVHLPIYSVIDDDGYAETGLTLVPAGGLQGDGDIGLALLPYAFGATGATIPISETLDLSFQLTGEVQGGFVLALRPSSGFNFSGLGSVPQVGANAAIELTKRPAAGKPAILLLGALDATRLQSQAFYLGFRGSLAMIEIEAGARDAKIVIVKGQGDGFLNKMLPETPIEIPFELGVGWSSQKGIYFAGGVGLAITLAIHQDIFGVLKVETIDLALYARGTDQAGLTLQFMAAITAALTLGPFYATVERIGLRGDVTFPESGGNLGIANLALRFKPPDGAGMSLKAKAVTGGGYLFFDPDNGQYAGILHLAVQDKIALTVIGLLTTRLPDGRKGFSLLLIITAEFPPIQLGYGFVLLGVGGLIGVHRTMVVDALRAGVKGGGLNSILFPQNPVENAQKIISDLKTFFPPAENRFTFGPMVKIAWGGAYPLLTIDLGILIELPAPVRVALLGRITLALPKREQPEDKVIVHIQMDILGVLDFEKSDLSIDATLFDSSIATFPLTGDMALRFNWGANPDFALSAGGFHPAYNPPPGFPVLGRLALSIASGDNPRIRAESYLAVTTAAAMMGASVELYAERDFGGLIGKFSVQAHLGFDALVRFVPFSFVVDMGADASLRRNNEILFAVALRLTLSGPQPWDARGYARFDFLGRHEIPFALTVGAEPEPAPLPISRPIDDLVVEVAKASNWTAQMPAGGQSVVSLREMERDPKVILAHPLGRVTFRQQIVPLQTEISRYGETQVSGPRTFDLAVELGGQAAPLPSMIRDNFAPGMFSELSDEAKLGEPAFVALPSGYQGIGLADSRAIFGHSTTKTFAYDEVVIDNLEARDRTRKPRFQLAADLLDRAALVGAAAVADLRTTGAAAFAGPDDQRVTLLEPAYVVADTDTLAATGAAAASHYEAKLKRQREGKNAAQRQVVGKYEAR